MSQQKSAPHIPRAKRGAGRSLRPFVFTLLAIEFLDELVDGSRQAAWPLLRDSFALSYTEIGLLLGVPHVAGNLLEPALGILGDVWRRRPLVLAGGIGFTLALLLVAFSQSFLFLLLALVLFNPSSGAFVGLSQAALMDAAPARREQNMARWAFAGSLGIVAGSVGLGVAVSLGAGWRGWFGALAVLSLLLVSLARRFPFALSTGDETRTGTIGFKQGAANALRALRRREVLRWLVLLEFADLMLDGFHGYLALYFADVAGVSGERAGLAVAVWTGVGLAGDLLLIPLLERVRGLRYLRWSALVMLLLFPAFLLALSVASKLILLGLIGIANAGWYSILKAQLYAAMPNQSGTVMTIGNLTGFVGGLLPLGIGLLAERFGLSMTMWLLLAGPLALLLALPRGQAVRSEDSGFREEADGKAELS